ncbi:hypothetical protein M8J75_007106 [Diaphorina citri]|nr:hypothetical protein M8J75_007106 [Diaphorina citri]
MANHYCMMVICIRHVNMTSERSLSSPSRRPFLRFPPPPPYPPNTPNSYSYAYYDPGIPGPSTSKHTFINCYGTEENIYEEIGASGIEEEVRYVHSRHLQVLDELNLTMEAMLMPDKSSPPPTSNMTPAEELLSPASYSIDSGFSGSSSGTNSLGRNTAPIPSPSCSSSKGKKIPQKLWKRLPSISKSTSQLNNSKPLHVPCSVLLVFDF